MSLAECIVCNINIFIIEFVCLRYPDLERTSFVRSVISQPAWPFFETEDERESLSFLRL